MDGMGNDPTSKVLSVRTSAPITIPNNVVASQGSKRMFYKISAFSMHIIVSSDFGKRSSQPERRKVDRDPSCFLTELRGRKSKVTRMHFGSRFSCGFLKMTEKHVRHSLNYW